jgi:hypothetical protein
MEVADIPKAWRSALASVQVLYPDAVMAGGCLRDREQGVKVKDIDIFVPCESTDVEHGRRVRRAMAADGWQDIDVVSDKTYNGERISMSLETKFPGCPPINIIVMPYALKEFDFGICQIEFDGKRILRTRDYHLDKRAQVFRLVPVVNDSEFVRSLERWSRLKEKYPSWKLNLGSRATTPGQPLVFDHGTSRTMNVGGPITLMTRKPLEATDLSELLRKRGGEFVYPKRLAERIAKELALSIVKPHPNSTDNFKVTVHHDEVPMVARMMHEHIEENERRMRDNFPMLSTLGRP